MSLNIKYSLPPHVSVEMLVQSISRIVGSQLSYEGLGNPLLDSSLDNLWIAKPNSNFSFINVISHNERETVRDGKEKLSMFFNKDVQDLNSLTLLSYFNVYVKLLDDETSQCILCEPSSDHFNHLGRGRALCPSSNLFWASIITRVAEMFGGTIIYSDGGDEKDPRNLFKVTENMALYPEQNKKLSSIERQINFSNALRKIESIDNKLISFLTTKKILKFNSEDKRIESLLRMGVLRFQEELENIIPINDVSVGMRKTRKF